MSAERRGNRQRSRSHPRNSSAYSTNNRQPAVASQITLPRSRNRSTDALSPQHQREVHNDRNNYPHSRSRETSIHTSRNNSTTSTHSQSSSLQSIHPNGEDDTHNLQFTQGNSTRSQQKTYFCNICKKTFNHRNTLYDHGWKVHGQRLSTRGNTSAASSYSTPIQRSSSRKKTQKTQPDFHRKSHIPPPASVTQGDTRRAIASSASYPAVSQIVDILPENALDDVLSIIGTDHAEQQRHTEIVLADPATTYNTSSSQPPTSSSITSVCQVPTSQGINTSTRPWQNSRSIEDFATQLYHKRYDSVEEIIQDGKFNDITSRDRDLLTVMLSLSNATLRLVANEQQRLITDIVASQPTPQDLKSVGELGRLTQRIRR